MERLCPFSRNVLSGFPESLGENQSPNSIVDASVGSLPRHFRHKAVLASAWIFLISVAGLRLSRGGA
jgi:hypothetical protein